ncbi:MAG TPA: carboxypeptidase regulatory-like domain-containing protein [Terriglobales bacterium]
MALSNKFIAGILLAGLFLFTNSLWAQNSGSITGTVVDPAGAVIPEATVQAVDQAKGVVVRETKTGGEGLFRLDLLQPSIYTLRINAGGMKELIRRDVNLDPNQVLGLGQVIMEIGSASEHVEVAAITPLVETATADHSAIIDSKQVTETLLNGRDFQSLMKSLPGVTSNNASDFQLQFNNTDQMHINGLRGSANNVFLDGAINTDVGANDGQFTQLSMDAVGEFKLISSNFAAEYGRNPGILIAINTKSGTKDYHGTLYEFNREDGFGAKPWGSKTTNFLRLNVFGGNLGGPIPIPKLKEKMFFFFNYEGTRGLRPGNTQFAGTSLPGVGNGYDLPDPKWIGIGTTNGAYDFTSAYQYDATTGLPVNDPNGYNVNQIYVPGSITSRDTSGRPLNGTPICMNGGVACNIIQPNDLNLSSQAQAWINYWKPHYLTGYRYDPRYPNNGGLFNKVFVPYNETYQLFKHQEILRYDWNVNPKTNFFFRWVDDSQKEQYHNLFDYADYPILPEYRKKPGSSWEWNLVNVISPTLTNEFIFSYNHLTQVVDIQPGTPKSVYDLNALGFTFQQLYPNSNVDNRAPVITCCNGTFSGQSFHPGWHSEARQFTWTDNMTKVAGTHTLKFGAFFDYNQAGQQPVWTDTPYLQFNTGSANPHDSNQYVSNVLFGYFTQAQQTNGMFFGAFRFHQLELFGQDSWKVNNKLTIDYGLRWGYLGPTYTVQPFFANYWDITKYNPAQAVTLNSAPGNYQLAICSAALAAMPPTVINGTSYPQCPGVTNFGNPYNGLVQEGHGIPPGFAKHRYNNFAPRFGFSYDPVGDGKTAIRGGIGIFYERIRQNINSFDLLGNPPLSYTATVFNNRLDNIGPQNVTGILTPNTINAFDGQGQIPTITGYSLGVQREMPGRIGLELAYVGNTARHLQYQYNANALPVGAQVAAPNPIEFYGPYKGFKNIQYTKYGANSSYNSLQVKATRRFHRDLTLTADYVYSSAMDLMDNDNGNINLTNGGGAPLTDPYNQWRDWAHAGFDRTHVFNLNYVYAIPYNGTGVLKHVLGDWQIGGLWKWWSGPPVDVLMTCSDGTCGDPGNFIGVVRPDRVPGVPLYLSHSNREDWFNPAAFAAPASNGDVGNIRRNAFRGPGINNWDMSLFKNIHFTERAYLQLRLETYNTFNHPQPNSLGPIRNNQTVGFTAATAGAAASTFSNSQGYITGFRDARAIQLAGKFYF